MPQKETLKAVIKRKKKSIPTEEGRRGKNYLFIIAINDYPNYNKLYNAVEDAKAIEQVLEERYVFDDIFSLQLGGYCSFDGNFSLLGRDGTYWTSTEKDVFYAWLYRFGDNNKYLHRGYYDKMVGFSCRCLKD